LASCACRASGLNASRPRSGFNGYSSIKKITDRRQWCFFIFSFFFPSYASLAEGVPRNEAVVELLREQKKERGKIEFEERLKGAELAHAEEQAIAARGSATAKGSETPASRNKPGTIQETAASTDVVSSTKSRSLWTRWFGWGSSKDSSESNNKS